MDTPKFTFRPSRPLSDSAEKLRQQLQRQVRLCTSSSGAPLAICTALRMVAISWLPSVDPLSIGPPHMQKEGGKAEQSAPQREQAPAAGKAAALNAKAAEAAAQPLPDSEDSDDDALGDVKGIMRTGPQKENGAIAKKPLQVILHASPTGFADGLAASVWLMLSCDRWHRSNSHALFHAGDSAGCSTCGRRVGRRLPEAERCSPGDRLGSCAEGDRREARRKDSARHAKLWERLCSARPGRREKRARQV